MRLMRFAIICLIGLMGFFSALSLANAQTPDDAAPCARPAYVLVVGATRDRAKMAAYASTLPPIYATLDAYYLAIGATGRGVTWLEGPWGDRSLVLVRFPCRASVETFWWGEPYRAAIRKRDNAGAFSVVAFDGAGPTPFQGADTGFLIVMTTKGDGARDARAAIALSESIAASGGAMLNSGALQDFTALEGDSVFNRITVAVWATKAARDAYLASAPARRAARLRREAGFSVVAAADGVPRSQPPTAVAGK